MRALLAGAATALALAVPASATTFAVVEPERAPAAALPGADAPNAPGALLLPPAVFLVNANPPAALDEAALRDLWSRAGAAYGVPWEVLAAINKVETNFGRNMGPSSAGAVGWMQFMPDTWLRWGLDASGDGVADPWNPQDAVFAAARYLAAAGAREDLRRGVFAYNHADWYVDQVLELAAVYAGGGADAAFALDRLEVDLTDAQAAVAAAAAALAEAEEREAELASRAAAEELLSDRLLLEQDAYAATAEVERLRDELAAAEAALEAARSGALPAAFAAPSLFGAPVSTEGYVFPVGGGPAVVSVGHDHHDYPAADLAAPEGTPVYALADALVTAIHTDPAARCGLGFTLAAADGQAWTYCHLSYVDPAVQPGASVAAGAFAGLVGSTGHSTGPHLHLQLEPAVSYPQEQPWFQAFAGTAFRWAEDAPPAAATPVFAVVPPAPEPADEVIEFTLSGS
jgi:murein DD-endopeptidase MepM/ murein hydrolase activator NlpD